MDAETAPLRNPEHYQYDLNLADVSELSHRGSVISSWLLDLTATALFGQHDLSKFSGRVSGFRETALRTLIKRRWIYWSQSLIKAKALKSLTKK